MSGIFRNNFSFKSKRRVVVESIIPKGATFWLENGLNEIASNVLFITNHVFGNYWFLKDPNILSSLINDKLLKDYFWYGSDLLILSENKSEYKLKVIDYDGEILRGVYCGDKKVVSYKELINVTPKVFSLKNFFKKGGYDKTRNILKKYTGELENLLGTIKVLPFADNNLLQRPKNIINYIPDIKDLEDLSKNLLSINLAKKSIGTPIDRRF